MTSRIDTTQVETVMLEAGMDAAALDEMLVYLRVNRARIEALRRTLASADERGEGDWSMPSLQPNTRLAILLSAVPGAVRSYAERGIPRDVLIDTLSDLVVRQELYQVEHGRPGLAREDADWLKFIFRLTIFKLGSLQYQIAPFRLFEWKGFAHDVAAAPLPLGTPVLDIHIRRGVDLRPQEVDRSFELSRSFFSEHFSDVRYRAYTCNSWMLYPGNQRLLPANSNILSLARRFDVYAVSADPGMALTYIYGKRYRSNADYPQRTLLQRRAIADRAALGVGCGILRVS